MRKFAILVLGIAVLSVADTGVTTSGNPESLGGDMPQHHGVRPVASHAVARPTTPRPSHVSTRFAKTDVRPAATADGRVVIEEYCLTCHDSDKQKGGLTLEAFDPGHPEDNAVTAEKMIRKLRAGMMPPPAADRPDPAALAALATSLEARLDALAAARPNPGRRTFQRLNRAEYASSVRDLLGLDVDVAAFLPPDTVSHNFDNIADVQTFSPTLLEGYLRAARRISRDAIGDPEAAPASTTYKVPRTASQLLHVDGAPFGTRGGISVVHTFPADGDYVFRMMLHSIPTGQLYGSTSKEEKLEVSIDGVRIALLDINPRMSEADPNGMNLQTPAINVKAGPHRVSAAFVQRFEGPFDDLLAPIEQTLADTQIGSAIGVTTVPHLRDFAIVGPHKVTGVSDTPTRRRIFTCRPLEPAEEAPCASAIVSALARQAYRRPVTAEDMTGLMVFYRDGRKQGDFEAGIRTALQAILASPHFIFRIEETPALVRAGQNYRVNDLDLASRLSFFLWAGPPDRELIDVASRGLLRNSAVLEKQVHRMLADPRAAALATRFAAQWLRLQDLEKIHPDPLLYPNYDRTLADAMRRETELLFEHIVREDRSVLDLITAGYTFVNARLAKHYGIDGVAGDDFRRVALGDDRRRGLLGQGSVLTMTSVADRTSPVLRGKWVMEVLLGSPPPPPPPDVPDFEETKATDGNRLLSVRERLEAHRASPACRSCHRVIDPIGLALENFDATGAWRMKDNGVPVDASGELYDGSKIKGPVELRRALLDRSETVLRTFTENLLVYALGRRVEYYDMPTVRSIVREAEPGGHRVSSYVLGVVKSPAFQMARADS